VSHASQNRVVVVARSYAKNVYGPALVVENLFVLRILRKMHYRAKQYVSNAFQPVLLVSVQLKRLR
jgi:hypothetical protein